MAPYLSWRLPTKNHLTVFWCENIADKELDEIKKQISAIIDANPDATITFKNANKWYKPDANGNFGFNLEITSGAEELRKLHTVTSKYHGIKGAIKSNWWHVCDYHKKGLDAQVTVAFRNLTWSV